jgi:hypothetical protein
MLRPTSSLRVRRVAFASLVAGFDPSLFQMNILCEGPVQKRGLSGYKSRYAVRMVL